MLDKIMKIFGGKDSELRERMLRSILVIGGVATVIGMTEIFLVMDITKVLLPVLFFLLLVMCLIMYITFKYQSYDLAATILGLVIIGIVFPILFLLSGALLGGASIWLSLGIVYIFVMFSGKKLAVFLALTVASYGVTYYIAYHYDELVVAMPSMEAAYVDSVFSIFAVGLIAGLVLKVHMKVYEEEHSLNVKQREELEQEGYSKDVFFANMSHEIRTPINAIMGLNEMILRTSNSPEVLEYAKDIQSASKMLLNQVNDILDLSQMEVDKMYLVPVNYNTKQVIHDLVEMVYVQLDKKGLDFHLEVDKNIPAVLYGDEKRFKQILLNLLDNAVKYTEEGTVTLSITGEEYTDDSVKLVIRVVDTGIGIRKENLEGIYDAFNRYDEVHNRRIAGTGLGLAITKQLVEMMDGQILVDSIYRKGTTFTFIVTQKIIDSSPIGNVEYFSRAADKEEYRPLFEAPEARILIVDDSNINRMVTERLLSETKLQIDTACSGAECLNKTEEKFYHAILLDYMMPDMDGISTLRAIRGQANGLCRDTAIIALTANSASDARQIYMEQGFDGYVEKPIQGKLLEKEILAWIPDDIVEYRDEDELGADVEYTKTSVRKRKKIYITADCTCDIPTELLEAYDIKLMYLYIKTPNGRFADTREIDSDSIAQYVTPENTTAFGDKVSLEEYEEFFAESLLEAEEVIHIALASKMGASCNTAMEAAKGFDHVHIIDSGHISCGQGLVALHAAKLAMEGKTVAEICKEVNERKNHIRMSFVMPGAEIFYHSGRMRGFFAKLCKLMQLHPYAGVKQKRTKVYALLGGTLEKSWKQAIFLAFRFKKNIDKNVVFIAHVGCTVRQQEILKKEILKKVPFQTVITNKTSFTTACSVGVGTIGFAYYVKPEEEKQ